jgi:hypothetical protein
MGEKMSITTYSGGRLVLEKRRRIRGADRLRELDDLILEKYYRGNTIPDIAAALRYTPSYVYRRFKAIPTRQKAMARRVAQAAHRAMLEELRDAARDLE